MNGMDMTQASKPSSSTMSSSTFRASVKSGDFQVDHFQATFPRAKAFQVDRQTDRQTDSLGLHYDFAGPFQGSLGVLAFVAGGLTLLLEPRRLASKIFFAGGTAMILLWPYTLVVIMPINRKLMNGNGKAHNDTPI